MIAKFRKSEKDSLGSKIFLILLFCFVIAIIGFLVITNLKLGQKRKELHSRISFLEKEFISLKETSQKLKTQLSQISQEDFAEKILREKGMYKKPGEGVLVITKENEKKEEKKEEGFLEKTSGKISTGFSGIIEKIANFFEKIF